MLYKYTAMYRLFCYQPVMIITSICNGLPHCKDLTMDGHPCSPHTRSKALSDLLVGYLAVAPAPPLPPSLHRQNMLLTKLPILIILYN